MPRRCPRDLARHTLRGVARIGTGMAVFIPDAKRLAGIQCGVLPALCPGGRETSAHCLKRCATVNWRGTDGGSLHAG
jgi:hypothetical protein